METIVAIIVAMTFGMVTIPAATLSGNGQAYCEKVLAGTYTPGKPDVCPNGDWSRVLKAIKE